MTETIELHSFRTSDITRDTDIEDYHEVSQDFRPGPSQFKNSTRSSREYDFFTQEDAKIDHKGSLKKKKATRKERTPNLMDLISSELSSVAVPVATNVISLVEESAEQINSYLVKAPRLQKLFQRFRPSPLDTEHGWTQNEDIVTLHPVFPRVAETTTSNDLEVPVQYKESEMFDNVVTKYLNSDLHNSPKFLDIEIKNLRFRYHHQFSLEKLLVTKLVELYNYYCDIRQSLKDIEKEIKINRETRDNIKQELLKISPNKKDDIRFDQTVRKYTGNLLDAKDKHIEASQKEKEIIHKIISVWSDIEMVRERTEFRETDYNMTVKEIVLSKDEFEEAWGVVFNEEFNDILDTIEYEYVSKYIEYKEVKNARNLDDSAKRKISKPKLYIDEEALKEEVEGLVNKIVRKSKTELFLNSDSQSEFDTLAKNSMKHEYYFEIYVDDVFACQSERRTIHNLRISDIDFSESFSLQILPNNKHLCITLHEDERDVASVQINLTDVKKSNASSDFVAESFIYNDIIAPNNKFVGSGHNIKEIAAANKVRLKSSNLSKGNLYTTCEVCIKVGWNDKLSQNSHEAIKCSMDIGRQLKRLMHGIDRPNINALSDIIGKLYDKDISKDENLTNNLRRICTNAVRNEDTFYINENSPEFIRLKLLHLRNNGGFTGVESKMVPIHASQISTEQLNCLQKSSKNEFEAQYFSDKCSEMDPIELQRFIAMKYVQKLNRNMLMNLKEHLLRKTHKDVVRDFKDLSLRSLFTKTSLATLASISASTRQQLLLEGLGLEQEVRVTIQRAFSLPDRRGDEIQDHIAGYNLRPLRPFVKISYHGVAAYTATAMGCHPTWNQAVKINTRLEPVSDLHVNIYDECKTYSEAAQAEEGGLVNCRQHSRWLGSVVVPMYTVLSLGALRGTFRISTPPILFGYENHTKESSQSLVPAVTQLMKKDSCFISLNITTSLSHLGGLHEYNQPNNTEDDYIIKHLNNFVTEFVNDFPNRHISLTFIDSSGKNKCVTQFLQPLPLPDLESFPRNPKPLRSESAVSKSSGWSKSSSTKSREEEKLSQNGEEKESLYSASESWVGKENHLSKCMDVAVRYVSLVPTYEVTEAYAVTLLGVELLKVVHGTPRDHAVLLASYFLHLGLRCYVAAGLGLPRGASHCVLVKYDVVGRRYVMLGDKERRGLWGSGGYVWYVYDACAGERSELRDAACPLNTVEYVFDSDNIWVNIQPSQDCESVAFDLAKSSDWRPVFDKSIFVMQPPALSEPGVYSAAADAERLRRSLESRLKEKVQKWRPRVRTIWNRYCSSLLRETLPHWEYWSFHPADPKPVVSQRLKQLLATYKLYGFPLNIPFINTKSVISAVKSTGAYVCDDPSVEFGLAVEVYAYPNNLYGFPLNIPFINTKSVISAVKSTGAYVCDDPSVEFGLAVEVYAYPNNVISVWVFIASITRL